MNKRITESFTKGKAFIPFITCGDPSLEVTEQLVYAMEEAGADLIELGIPFSDPTAEGPVIQAANIRALSGGVTTDKVFEMVEKIRKNSSIPMVFMTYANVVFSYGTERFVKKAAEVGMDGLILPDVPFEEKEEFDGVCKEYGLDYRAAFHGCASDTEPSLATLKYLIDKVEEAHIPVVYTIELSSRKVAQAIAETTGAKVLTFQSCQTVSRQDMEAGATYLSLMWENVEALKEGLA